MSSRPESDSIVFSVGHAVAGPALASPSRPAHVPAVHVLEGRSVLPAENRLRSSTEFSDVVRRGRRASRPLLTVHLLPPAPAGPGSGTPPRAGLVVSKAVGGSVVRHQVSRRLRHQLRLLVPELAAGTRLVVRAAPAAATADSAALSTDLRAALGRLQGR